MSDTGYELSIIHSDNRDYIRTGFRDMMKPFENFDSVLRNTTIKLIYNNNDCINFGKLFQ